MITINNLHIGYKKSLLQVHNLQLKPGQLYILIGKNGSGKSTFLKNISGEIPYLSGSLIVDGNEIKEIRHNKLPFLISTVRSSFNDVDYLTTYNYIALGRSPYTNLFGKLTESDDKAIMKSIELVGINHLRDRFTSELSDGERQLVSIAKAIAQETNVILLDEPTAYLDYLNRMKILKVMTEIAINQDKCIIMSSHDIDIAIESKCPFLVITKKGKVELSESMSKDDVLRLAFAD